MSDDAISVLAGDCTVRFEDDDVREERGSVVVLTKPDGTVLVHDTEGYRPIAWLTRAEEVTDGTGEDGPTITASENGRRLEITCHAEHGGGDYPATRAGRPVGACPDCIGSLVKTDGGVECLGCETRYGLPEGATLRDQSCDDCGLPTFHVNRGAGFDLCIDRDCQPMDAAVSERFDRVWACPECGGDLRILRRGRLIAGCERYPDCEAAFLIPDGTVDGACVCGLPAFETPGGRRCLDATCQGT